MSASALSSRGRMKTVQIDLSQRANKSPVSDGVGGKHAHGAVVQLPADVADALIGLKVAFPVDGSSLIEAQRKAKEQAEINRLAEQRAAAARRMQLHDNLPPDVRAAVHEFGDEATEAYLAHLQQQEAEAERARVEAFNQPPAHLAPRRRGRPRKQPRLDA